MGTGPRQELPTRAADVECVVCRDTKPAGDFPGSITPGCQHDRDVCRPCVARTVEMEMSVKGNLAVICPHPGCDERLGHGDVRREAGRELFERFDELAVRKLLNEDPSFRWCSRPGCGSGHLVEGLGPGPDGRNTWLRCPACGQLTCAFHRCPWHTERTCQEYDEDAERSDEVALLQILEREDTKRCPKCHHAIEKSGGCDHMTCRTSSGGCGAEFCWRCLADYQGPRGIHRRGNSAHARNCPFYFSNPESDGESDTESDA